jgi:glucokinase
MAKLMHLGENLTSKDIDDLARQPGDVGERARAIWRTMGEALGIALANLVNTFNFPLYLLSGGMLPAWEFFAPPMMAELERRSFTYRVTKDATRVAQATLGNEAGLYGAAYLPWIET